MKGRLFTGSNGNQLFLPAAGAYKSNDTGGSTLTDYDASGYYFLDHRSAYIMQMSTLIFSESERIAGPGLYAYDGAPIRAIAK